MSNKSLIAGLIALAMGVWLFSGGLVSSMVTAAESDMPVPAGMALVRGIESVASERQQLLAVRGQTRANRVVQVKSEVSRALRSGRAICSARSPLTAVPASLTRRGPSLRVPSLNLTGLST